MSFLIKCMLKLAQTSIMVAIGLAKHTEPLSLSPSPLKCLSSLQTAWCLGLATVNLLLWTCLDFIITDIAALNPNNYDG